jgi:hypothetical protein
METKDRAHTGDAASAKRRRHWILLGVAVWAAVAYLVVPRLWSAYFKRARPLPDVARVTHTSDGHPGDLINIALEGGEQDVARAMLAAGWFPADPVTFKSSVLIAVDKALRRPDETAPVSPLFLFERIQDLAYEQPVPGGPRDRHHVRFWRWDQTREGLPVWFGSVTYDARAGLSYTTGQVTHHISGDVDADRDRLATEVVRTSWARAVEWIDNFHQQGEGRNGGGDAWHTDGRLAVVRLASPQGASLERAQPNAK